MSHIYNVLFLLIFSRSKTTYIFFSWMFVYRVGKTETICLSVLFIYIYSVGTLLFRGRRLRVVYGGRRVQHPLAAVDINLLLQQSQPKKKKYKIRFNTVLPLALTSSSSDQYMRIGRVPISIENLLQLGLKRFSWSTSSVYYQAHA